MASAPNLIEILKKTGAVSAENLKRAQELQRQNGKKLIRILLEEGILAEKDLVALLSAELDIPVLSLGMYKISPNAVELVPRKIAERFEIMPVARISNVVTIAMSDPLDVFAIDDLKEITKCNVRPVISTSKDIQVAIDSYYTEETKFDELVEDFDPDTVEVVNDLQTQEVAAEGSAYAADQAPVIRMVNLILQEAIRNRASDIHFEPYEDRLRIRFRIDGVLREAFVPPREMYNAILTRLKIVSDLDITEKRLPQDGRFKARFESREIDFRVSLLPTYFGEKAVLRVLDKTNVRAGLHHLGFTPDSVKKFQEAIKRPYGMALVTGPTGSGKSTTLYAILNEFNTKERNIMTVEDPIEYQVEGITQTQVNPDIGLTFANGLRSLLRQSPDIILVGEIRDSETADIAIKSALTGHLVFSTLHTNNAAGAIARLVDMGVEPFLVSASLVVITAQRLMRKICPNCKVACEIDRETLERFPASQEWVKNAVPYRGAGCNLCRNTGYHGRIATMEVLVVDQDLQQLIVENRPTGEIEALARKKGMRSLYEDALISFQTGQTTLEEVLRITTTEDL